MIPAYSPEARGRCERMPQTHQARLPKELAAAGITDMAAANEYLQQVYLPAFNEAFKQPAMEAGSAFVPFIGGEIDESLCEQYERVVGKENAVSVEANLRKQVKPRSGGRNYNCVAFEGLRLQIPKGWHRLHYVQVRVRVHCYADGRLALFHGPRCLARYDACGQLLDRGMKAAAQVRRGRQSGQFMCYSSGQIYLLLTVRDRV